MSAKPGKRFHVPIDGPATCGTCPRKPADGKAPASDRLPIAPASSNAYRRRRIYPPRFNLSRHKQQEHPPCREASPLFPPPTRSTSTQRFVPRGPRKAAIGKIIQFVADAHCGDDRLVHGERRHVESHAGQKPARIERRQGQRLICGLYAGNHLRGGGDRSEWVASAHVIVLLTSLREMPFPALTLIRAIITLSWHGQAGVQGFGLVTALTAALAASINLRRFSFLRFIAR